MSWEAILTLAVLGAVIVASPGRACRRISRSSVDWRYSRSPAVCRWARSLRLRQSRAHRRRRPLYRGGRSPSHRRRKRTGALAVRTLQTPVGRAIQDHVPDRGRERVYQQHTRSRGAAADGARLGQAISLRRLASCDAAVLRRHPRRHLHADRHQHHHHRERPSGHQTHTNRDGIFHHRHRGPARGHRRLSLYAAVRPPAVARSARRHRRIHRSARIHRGNAGARTQPAGRADARSRRSAPSSRPVRGRNRTGRTPDFGARAGRTAGDRRSSRVRGHRRIGRRPAEDARNRSRHRPGLQARHAAP